MYWVKITKQKYSMLEISISTGNDYFCIFWPYDMETA